MKFFKNKKLMIILSCAILVCVVLSVILYFSLANKDEKNNLPKNNSKPEIADTKNEKNEKNDDASGKNNSPDISQGTKDKNNSPDISEGNGPVNIHGGDNLVEKIDKFNSLNDDDPEKEKIRKELEDLFEYAEGATFN